MRNLTTSFTALAWIAAPAATQESPDPKQLEQRFRELQAEAWFRDGGWTADLTAAKEMAQERKRPILAYFTRSHTP